MAIILGLGATQAFAQCAEEDKLTASDAAARDWFGLSVALSGDTALVGAWLDDCTAGDDCGSAYVFRFNGFFWVEEQKLTALDAAAGDWFGVSVSVSGDTALVGAFSDDCTSGNDCGSAYIFRFNGTSWVQEHKLTASDAAGGDDFGISVSLSGDTAVVGARLDDCAAGNDCGAAYVFRFNGTVWDQEQKLTASDAAMFDEFGWSVSVSGGTVLVGAQADDCAAGAGCGSAYVFRFNGTSWDQEQKLTAADAGAGDAFGHSVSLSGETAVVGAYRTDDLCPKDFFCDSGSAYVFRFDGTNWVEEQELTASDASPDDEFGSSVSVSGDTVVVGAWQDNCPLGARCGSAYVYLFNGTDWLEDRKLVPLRVPAFIFLGNSVAVSGGTVLVGAPNAGCTTGDGCGAAYLFDLDLPCLTCGNVHLDEGEECDGTLGCGNCLCKSGYEPTDPPSLSCEPICGDGSLVQGEDCDGGFACTDCLCDPGYTSTDPPSADCMPICGSRSVVPREECDLGLNCTDCVCDAGYESTIPLSINCQAKCGDGILVPEEECDEGLGCLDCFCDSGYEPMEPPSFDCQPICGDGTLVPGEDCDGGDDAACPGVCLSDCTCGPFCGNGACDSGELCSCTADCGLPPLFELFPATCTDGLDNDCDGVIDADDFDCAGARCALQQKLTAVDAQIGSDFDRSMISVSGDTIAVGAQRDDCAAGVDCGSVFVYRFNGTDWIFEQKLTASDAEERSGFGKSVSVNRDIIIIGTTTVFNHSNNAYGVVYVFRYNGKDWVEEQKLTATNADGSRGIGNSVSVYEDTIVVGARFEACPAGFSCGAAYIFRFNGASWVETQKLIAPSPTQGARFGESVSVDGDTVLIAAPPEDCEAGELCGAAYVFQFNGVGWVFEQKLSASDSAADEWFGQSISVSGDVAVLGARSIAGCSCGSAYTFRFNGSEWVEEQKLSASDRSWWDGFGKSVSISGNTIVVGADSDDFTDNLFENSGSAYVFQFSGTRWVEKQKLVAFDRHGTDYFGASVSISGDRVVVEAPGDRRSGSAYVFHCLPEGTCADAVAFIDPQVGTVDARQPHAMQDASALMGIDSISVLGTPGTDVLDCWSLCVTDDVGTPNSITSIDNNGDGTYTLHLERPIAPGGVTEVTATLRDGSEVSAMYTLHPGNVNGDNFVTGLDLFLLLDVLNGDATAPWGDYSVDIDHSGQVAAADILRLIDLFNGAGEYDSWLGTLRPGCGACCPTP